MKIHGFTREPNGSEPHGSVLFIRTSLVRIAEPNWSRYVGASVHGRPIRTSLGSEPYGSALVCTGP